MKEAGWEIATHGLKWIEYKDFAKEDERARVHQAIRIHTKVSGSRPLGFYQGRTSARAPLDDDQPDELEADEIVAGSA
jgi:chitin deacetylase